MMQPPQIETHVTNIYYVDDLVDNATLLRLHPDEELNIPNQDYITLNSSFTSPETIIWYTNKQSTFGKK